MDSHPVDHLEDRASMNVCITKIPYFKESESLTSFCRMARSSYFLLLLGLSGIICYAGDDLEMICEHTVVPENSEVILYVTLRNKASTPVSVVTCLPNTGVAIRGGTWMFSLSSNWYAEGASSGETPIRERLLPVVIAPNQSCAFTQRFPTNTFKDIPPVNPSTYVACSYGVREEDARRYKIWGGQLTAQSVYVPFYEKK